MECGYYAMEHFIIWAISLMRMRKKPSNIIKEPWNSEAEWQKKLSLRYYRRGRNHVLMMCLSNKIPFRRVTFSRFAYYHIWFMIHG